MNQAVAQPEVKPATKAEIGTDVAEFISDLDAGTFERKLALALSSVAAAAMDNNRTGEVIISLKFMRIPGTSQIHCYHKLQFNRPTMDGKATEEETRVTPLFVGKNGRLSLVPENQTSFLERNGEVK